MRRSLPLIAALASAICAIIFLSPSIRPGGAQATQNAPGDYDIRAGLGRISHEQTSGVAPVNDTTAISGKQDNAAGRDSLSRFERLRPDAQVTWSALRQAPARVWARGQALTAPARNDAETSVRRFLAGNPDLFRLDAGDLATLHVTRRYQDRHNGLTHLFMQQTIGGIDVFQGDLAAHVLRNGAILAVNGETIPETARLAAAISPQLSVAEALRLAATSVGVTLDELPLLKEPPAGPARKQQLDRGSAFSRDVAARLVWFPLAAGQTRLAWELTLWMRDTPDAWLTLIDAEKGTLLFRHNYTSYQENPLQPHGPVYTRDAPRSSVPLTTTNPPIVDREDLPFRAAPFNGAAIFPLADPHYDWWAGRPGASLISNNTDTFLDRDNQPNQPDQPRLNVADGNFIFPVDFTKPPTDPDNQKAAQVNLFYWINRYHDILYSYGFTESAGNFQANNFGRGGAGNDPILGNTQDGSRTNNATFATLPDGQPGVVEMYLWTFTTPQTDGSFDQGVILHELTHGLSNRLIGNATGLAGLQARGLGEGWSDYMGLVLLRNERDDLDGAYAVGQYVFNNYALGIRRYPYSTNLAVSPLTYQDIGRSANEHPIGEIWCNALLEMRAQLIRRYGFAEGQRQSIQLVVDGMKLTPRTPTFLDARDAILLADRVNNNGANQCLLWQAFARRGIGFDAETTDTGDLAPVESLAGAPACSPVGSLRTGKTDYVQGESIRISLGDQNGPAAPVVRVASTISGDVETVTLRGDAAPGSFNGQLRLASGPARPGDGLLQGSAEAGDRIELTYQDTNTGAGSATVGQLARFTREKAVLADDVELGNTGWSTEGAWAITNARAATPARCWTDSPGGSYANNTNASLTSTLLDLSGLSNITLTFAESHQLEPGYDFGLVEYSIDGGRTWRRAAAFTGAQTAFQPVTVRLRGLDHQSRARIRFRLLSDVTATADGWYIDDIRIGGRAAGAVIIPPGDNLAPVINAVTPAYGRPAGGERITLSGANFTDATDLRVTIGGAAATGIQILSQNALSLVTPAGPPVSADVHISTRYGETLLANGFTWYAALLGPPRPVPATLFPLAGSLRGGTPVTILGSGFTPDTLVTFDGRAAVVTWINPGTLRAVTPAANVTGPATVTLTTLTQTGALAGAFSYIDPTPPVNAVTAPGNEETILGGSVYNIRWDASDNSALSRHRLSLFRVTGQTQQLAVEIAASLEGSARSYNWIVPLNLPRGQYRIRVISADNEGTETEAYSGGAFLFSTRWEAARPLPTPVALGATVSDGRDIYLIGGRAIVSPNFPYLTTVLRWNPDTAEPWAPVPPLPVALSGHGAVHMKGKIYVPGGGGPNGAVSQQFVYDIAASVWSTLNMPTLPAVYSLAADETKGIYYFLGGNTFRSYQPETNTWTTLPSPPVERSAIRTALTGGRLYANGLDGAGTAVADVYDPATQRWTPMATPLSVRANAVSFVTTDTAGNPLWFLTGGANPFTGVASPPEVYEFTRNRWTLTDSSFGMLQTRSSLMGVVHNNFFYAIGGSSALTGSFNERFPLTPISPAPPSPARPFLAAPESHAAIAGIETRFTVIANDLGASASLPIHVYGVPPGAVFNVTGAGTSHARGEFRWTPGESDIGQTYPVTLTLGDYTINDIRTVSVRVVRANALAVANGGDYMPGVISPGGLGVIFGVQLAARAATASTLSPVFSLDGTSVSINGLPATLLYVSPGQINLMAPAALAPGIATVVVSMPMGVYSAGMVTVRPVVSDENAPAAIR
ncbi:MAG: M36 family metallopeptidase [Blastocatellia bacterium]